MDGSRQAFRAQGRIIMRSSGVIFGCLALFLCGGVAAPGWAAGPSAPQGPATTEQLIALATAAKEQFHPLPGDLAAKAHTKLKASVLALDRALAKTAPDNATRWREYLEWEALKAEVAKADEADAAVLRRVAAKFFQNYGSLEKPVFTTVRDDLTAYLVASANGADTALAEKYVARLDRLIEQLPQYEATPSADLRHQIGQDLGWLENAQQAPGLIAAVRRRHWSPNLYAEVSQRLVSAGIGEPVQETSAIEDCILGTSIYGSATMNGHTQVRFSDDPQHASLQIVLSGIVDSDNVGYNRGVKIVSRGTVTVSAQKTVRVDPLGLFADPATACCSTDSAICDILAKCRMIERVAWKKVGRSKAEAEAIGSRHAEERVAERMDERAVEMLAQARRDMDEKFRWPLLRRGEFPKLMQFATKSGVLSVVWRQAGPAQLAASSSPPPLSGERDVAVRVHESMVSNVSRAMLGGVTLTDKRLVEILEKNGREIPEELQLSDDKDAWSITFSPTDPVQATFLDNTIRFAIRGRRFTAGENTVNKLMELSAVYKMEKTPAGAHLVRQGDVVVEYVGLKDGPGLEEIAVRTVMRNKFEALFAPEFNTTGLVPEGRWAKIGTLHLEHASAQTGWLSLAWLQVPTVAPAVPTQVAQTN
jgi:hypothetical protein